MAYELKGGEEWIEGILHGWTGNLCKACKGYGEAYEPVRDADGPCRACSGTGDEYGIMPVQPPK